MDKRALRILLGCLACTVIVVLLFMVALKFTHLNCELVHIDPVRHRELAQSEWEKEKPVRSRDKSMLARISAYLVYHLDEASPSPGAPSPSVSSSSWGAPQVVPSSPLSATTASPLPSASSSLTTSASGKHPQPSMPRIDLLSELAAGNFSSLAAVAAGLAQNATQLATNGSEPQSGGATSGSEATAAGPEKRFLPLKLEEIETKRLKEAGEYEYKLSFNCTTMVMRLNRMQGRVERLALELQPAGRAGETKCEVELSSELALLGQSRPSSLSVPRSGEPPASAWHRYYCPQQKRFACNHPRTGEKLVDLYVNGIDLEVSSTSERDHDKDNSLQHKKHEFVHRKTYCSM